MLDIASAFVIAEIGVNHKGSIELAKEMISSAKKVGANAVKFQTFTAEALVSQGTPKVNYQKQTTDILDIIEVKMNHSIRKLKMIKVIQVKVLTII